MKFFENDNSLRKLMLICFLPIGIICNSQYRNNDDELRDYFSSVVYLADYGVQTTQIKGEQFEVLYRKPWTKAIIENKSLQRGSGFFIYRGLDVYLVTAEHVARILKPSSQLKYRDINGTKKEITIQNLSSDKNYLKHLNWVRHPKADIAVLHLGLIDNVPDDIVAIRYSYLIETLEAPNRLNDVTIIGFPLGLGITSSSISPITRNSRTASDIVYLKRFDNGVENPFVILDDPTIGGFSGGPVLELRLTPSNYPKLDGEPIKLAPKLVGLVHGTIGGFAVIVPASQILETIESSPKFNGEYTFYYPNGSLWSTRIYKDGLPWNVINNFDSNGKPQSKGTLKDGEGTFYSWNEKSTHAEVFHCSNGKCEGGVYSFKKDPFKKNNPKK